MLVAADMVGSLGAEITLGELIGGVGALALAAVAWWLADRTSEEVELTRESIEAIDRPFLVAATENFDVTPTLQRGSREPTGDKWVLYAKLENFGQGPAIFDGISLHDPDGNELADQSWETDSIFRQGESIDVGIPVASVPSEGVVLRLCLFTDRPRAFATKPTTKSMSLSKVA